MKRCRRAIEYEPEWRATEKSIYECEGDGSPAVFPFPD
jgi:hypothetical protein